MYLYLCVLGHCCAIMSSLTDCLSQWVKKKYFPRYFVFPSVLVCGDSVLRVERFSLFNALLKTSLLGQTIQFQKFSSLHR